MRSAALCLLLLACGGRAATHAEEQPPEAVGGSATMASPLPAGAGGTLFLPLPDLPDLPSSEPVRCDRPAPKCHTKGTYVQIDDERATQLTVPYDSRCASCWVPCEDCSFECELSAIGVSRCGVVMLRLAACAGGDQAPPCLDTREETAYYVDAGGKSWSVVALQGLAVTTTGPSTLDADLTLTLRDGATTRELSAHVRVCADVTTNLVPCK
jgi:hypothetical protein